MILSYWTLAVALSLSLIAAWYSIAGLAAIFAAAVVPIVIMGGVMEVAKITVTVWLHEYWQYCKRSMKIQLTASVVILMFITSMGIFGFLSKAHTDQALVSGDVGARIAVYDEKIKTARDNIEAARKALTQLDAAVDQTMSRSTDERGAERAVQIRRSQAAERTRLLKEIETEQRKIQALNEEAAPIRAEVRKVEAEVGPIKYIAALIYGDNPDANLLEKAVRWMIVILVLVFDPLAIMMVLAATESIKWERQLRSGNGRPESEPDTDDRAIKDWFDRARERARFWDQQSKADVPEPVPGDQHTHIPVETYYAPSIPPTSPVERKELAEDPMIAPEPEKVVEYQVLDDIDGEPDPMERPGDYLTDSERNRERVWKSQNPDSTLKHQRKLYETGKIDQLPWDTEEFKQQMLAPVADNSAQSASEVKGFGIAFPDNAVKGDMFLRVDRMPSALFKYNGNRWIEVDKKLSDQYAYDTAYIDHLIEKIDSGEYDPDLLSDAEQEQIARRLS